MKKKNIQPSKIDYDFYSNQDFQDEQLIPRKQPHKFTKESNHHHHMSKMKKNVIKPSQMVKTFKKKHSMLGFQPTYSKGSPQQQKFFFGSADHQKGPHHYEHVDIAAVQNLLNKKCLGLEVPMQETLRPKYVGDYNLLQFQQIADFLVQTCDYSQKDIVLLRKALEKRRNVSFFRTINYIDFFQFAYQISDPKKSSQEMYSRLKQEIKKRRINVDQLVKEEDAQNTGELSKLQMKQMFERRNIFLSRAQMFKLLDLSNIPVNSEGKFRYAHHVEKLSDRKRKKFREVEIDMTDELFQIGYEINKRQIPINELRLKYSDQNNQMNSRMLKNLLRSLGLRGATENNAKIYIEQISRIQNSQSIKIDLFFKQIAKASIEFSEYYYAQEDWQDDLQEDQEDKENDAIISEAQDQLDQIEQGGDFFEIPTTSIQQIKVLSTANIPQEFPKCIQQFSLSDYKFTQIQSPAFARGSIAIISYMSQEGYQEQCVLYIIPNKEFNLFDEFHLKNILRDDIENQMSQQYTQLKRKKEQMLKKQFNYQSNGEATEIGGGQQSEIGIFHANQKEYLNPFDDRDSSINQQPQSYQIQQQQEQAALHQDSLPNFNSNIDDDHLFQRVSKVFNQKKDNESMAMMMMKRDQSVQRNNNVSYQTPVKKSFGTLFNLFSTRQDTNYIYKLCTKQAVFQFFTFALIRKKLDKVSEIKRIVCYQNLYRIPKPKQSIHSIELLNLQEENNCIFDLSISEYDLEQSQYVNTFELTVFNKLQILVMHYRPFKRKLFKKQKIDLSQFNIKQSCLLNSKSFICQKLSQGKQEIELFQIRSDQITPIKLIAVYQNAQIYLKNINSATFVIYNKTKHYFDILDQRYDRVDRVVVNSDQQQKIQNYPTPVNYDHTLHTYQILELPSHNRVKLFYQDEALISKYQERPQIPNIEFQPLDFQNALFYFKMSEHRIFIKPNILFAQIRAKIASPFSPQQSYSSTPIEILGSNLLKIKGKQDLSTDFWVERVCIKWMMLKDQKRKRKLLIVQNLRNFKHQILSLDRKSTSQAYIVTSPRNNTYILVLQQQFSKKSRKKQVIKSRVRFWDGERPQFITCNNVQDLITTDSYWKIIDIFKATKNLKQIVKNMHIDSQCIRFSQINEAGVGVILYSNQVEYRNTIHNTHFFRKSISDYEYIYYLIHVNPNIQEVTLEKIQTKLNLHLLFCPISNLNLDSLYFMQFTRKDSHSTTTCNIYQIPQLKRSQSIDNIQSFLPNYHSQIVCQMTDFSSKILAEFKIKFKLQFEASLYLFGVRHLLFPNISKIIITTPFGVDEGGVPNKIPTTLKQFINYYVYFKTRLLNTSSYLKFYMNQSNLTQNSSITGGLSDMDMENQVAKDFIDQYFKLQSSLSKLYLELKDCDIDMLVFFLLCQNQSISQIKDKYGGDNFIIAFYQLICQNKRYEFFGLFKNQLDVLHSAIKNTNISLFEFYEKSIVQVEQVFKQKSKDQLNFQDSNRERSEKFSNQLGPQGNVKLEIYRSLFELPPPLSDANANFSYALSQTEDFRIFQTELIKRYIRLRWKSAFKYYLSQTILIIVTMILLFVHASFYREIGIVVPIFIISIGNSLIEIVQILALGLLQYLQNIWNWSDVLRVLLNFVYFIILAGDFVSDQVDSIILTSITLATFVKLTSIFSYFRKTRVLLRIFIEILYDMIPFFLFIVVTTLSIAIMYTSTILPNNLQNSSFLDNLEHAFLLDFGDFNLDGYTYLRNIIFVFATILVPLVLLNMLIAIMGDTYDRVKEQERTRDFHEIVYLLHVYEKMARVVCKRFRNKYQWKYIYFSKTAQMDAISNKYREGWEGRLKSIKNKVGKLEGKMIQFDKKLDGIGEDIQNILKQNKSVLELRKDLQKKITEVK